MNIYDRNETSTLKHGQTENYGFSCSLCGKSYKQKCHLKRHFTNHYGVKFSCSICGKNFGRKDTLRIHMLQVHNSDQNYKN